MHLKSKSSEAETAAGITSPLLASAIALEGGPRRDRWDRLRFVLGHPVHLICLGALMLMGVFAGSAWMLLPILALETVAAAIVPRLRSVQQRADRMRRERRRQIAARARSGLVAYMEAAHGRELTELERRATIARAHASTAGDAMEALIDDWYGLDRLLGTYVRLSIAHRTARESAALTDREKLCQEIRRLEHERDRASSPRLRRLRGRHLALLRNRAACLERNEEEREAISLELSSVASLCRMVHERTFALVSTDELHAEVERVVGEMELQDQALHELTTAHQETEAAATNTGVRVAMLERAEEEADDILDVNVLLRAGSVG
jgi:hypothetical protein